MKKIFIYFNLLAVLVLLSVSCKKDPVELPIIDNKKVDPVSQFVYDGMSLFYFWADEIVSKKPTKEDVDPKAYFSSLLNPLDKNKGWSYITDNVDELLADYSGEPKDFGISFSFLAMNQERTEYAAFIQYVYPNTPAANAGIKRLDIIGKINDQPITDNNFMTLYGGNAAKFSLFKLSSNGLVHDRDVNLTPTVNKTDPVLYKNVYEINGKKIGYLFYTSFIGEYNNSLYNAFEEFKTAGVTDLVVDLRYNRGGGSDASIYLAGLVAPKDAVEKKSPFVTRQYNKFLNDYFDTNNVSRTQRLGDFNPGTMKNPLEVNLNLNKVYIIATGGSYSASELVTFCLREYTDVIHIGGKTGGKFTSSFTIHPYNDYGGSVNTIYKESELADKDKTLLKNWALQPIVGMYANYKGVNFSDPGYLMPNYELKEGGGYVDYWKPIGDTQDVFLGQAIYLITGDAAYKPQSISSASMIKAENDLDVKLQLPNDKRSGDIIEDIKLTPKEYEEILRLKKLYYK